MVLPSLFLAFIAVASAAGDLTGAWILDPDASESVDAMLTAQGVSWAARKVAGNSTPTLRIRHEGGAIHVEATMPRGTSTEVFRADGEPHPTTGPDGATATWTSTWEGDVLVTVQDVTLGGGGGGRLTIRRSRSGATYVQQVELAITGGETLRARRVFQPVAG